MVLKVDYHDITDPLYSEPADIYDAADHNAENAQINTNTTAIAAKYTKPGTGIPTADIADNAITKVKIADDSVGGAELDISGTLSSTTFVKIDAAGALSAATPAAGGSVGATYPQTVAVTTGTETRPSGSDTVLWVGGATEPTNIATTDVWLADESSDESTLLWSIRDKGRKIPARRTNFRNAVNTVTPLTVDDTGQVVSYAASGGGLQIISGRLTLPVPGSGAPAGYRHFNAGALCTRIGARFTFGSAGSTNGSAVAIVLMNETFNAGSSTIRFGAHLVINPGAWIVHKYNHATSTFTTLANADFTVPLTRDGVTEYEAEIFHPTGNTVYIRLPDGSTTAITDTDIGSWAGNFAMHEVVASVTGYPAGFTETWADTGPQYIPPTHPVLEQVQARGELGHTQVSTSHTLATTSGAGALTGLSLAVPYRNRPIMLEVQLGLVGNSTSGTQSFTLNNAAGTALVRRDNVHVNGALESTQVNLMKYRIPAGSAADTYHVRGWAAAGTATLNAALFPMYIRADCV